MEIQTKIKANEDAAYSFGGFELLPGERLLRRGSKSIPLQPKAFDALLCLIGSAGHLVSKEALTETLWPSVYVSEANLTNIVVSLRKIVGREAIRTVSKHGYRFVLPVAGEPGLTRPVYEKFARAKELTARRSLDSMSLARELYWICLAEDPGFAPAWAWLGRCCWFLAKFSANDSTLNLEMAQAAFRRAFALDPDLACAHQFYTFLQVDTGQASLAMVRLLDRLAHNSGDAESYTGLVQVLRFCGLLGESLEANRRASELDPTVATSVAHTFFLAGEFTSAIESYSGRGAYYLDAAAWSALGHSDRAVTLLRERLARTPLSGLMSGLMSSLLALLEGRADEAVKHMSAADTASEPEIQIYFARHYARMGLGDAAVSTLQQAARSGFTCAPDTLRSDPWLSAVRKHPNFPRLLESAETLVAAARSAYAAPA